MLRQSLIIAALVVASVQGQEVTTLKLNTPTSAQIAWGDSPVFCYTPPFGNVLNFFDEVSIEVTASEGVPSVYGASRDDIHGLIDSYIKSAASGEDFNGAVAARAKNRDDFATPLDLLHECPPMWNSSAQSCTKYFSPFGPSCVAITMRKKSSKLAFEVTARSQFQKGLPIAMVLGALILWFAKYLAKSKVVWYSSGVSISVAIGLLILVIFACRKIKMPGANRTGFTIVSALGYGAVCMRYVAGLLKAVAAKYWQLIAIYSCFFGALGVIYIARVRRSEERKHDFRVTVLWALRILGVVLLARGTRSSIVGLVITIALAAYYTVTRFSIGQSSKNKTNNNSKKNK